MSHPVGNIVTVLMRVRPQFLFYVFFLWLLWFLAPVGTSPGIILWVSEGIGKSLGFHGILGSGWWAPESRGPGQVSVKTLIPGDRGRGRRGGNRFQTGICKLQYGVFQDCNLQDLKLVKTCASWFSRMFVLAQTCTQQKYPHNDDSKNIVLL